MCRVVAREEKLADESAEANEQRDKRAARSLPPADARVGFERNFNVRSESVAFAGATVTASDLERHSQPLGKESRFIVEVTRTFSATLLECDSGLSRSFPTPFEPDLVSRGRRYLAAFEHPETPNKAPEPTPTAGTSAAEQPLVPAAVVAHL